jgi:hypothetical protein
MSEAGEMTRFRGRDAAARIGRGVKHVPLVGENRVAEGDEETENETEDGEAG